MTIKGAGRARIDTESLVGSIVIMLFAVFIYAVTFTFEEVPPILAQGVEPTVFPRAIIILMFALAALQAFNAVRLSPADIKKLKPYQPIPAIVYLTALVLIAFFIGMPLLGTFPTLILFCPALALLWGERRWLLMGLSFAAFIAFAYVLFRIIMNVPLP